MGHQEIKNSPRHYMGLAESIVANFMKIGQVGKPEFSPDRYTFQLNLYAYSCQYRHGKKLNWV